MAVGLGEREFTVHARKEVILPDVGILGPQNYPPHIIRVPKAVDGGG